MGIYLGWEDNSLQSWVLANFISTSIHTQMHREAKFTHDLPIQPYNKGIKWQTELDRERKKNVNCGAADTSVYVCRSICILVQHIRCNI